MNQENTAKCRNLVKFVTICVVMFSCHGFLFYYFDFQVVASDYPGEIFKRDVLPVEEFEIKDRMGMFIVPVQIGGKSYPFGLDTGCSLTIYDQSFLPLLGPANGTTTVKTPNGVISLKTYNSINAKIGSTKLTTKENVLCADLAFTANSPTKRIFGLIGMSFLKKYTLFISPPKSKILIYNENPLVNPGNDPIRYDDRGLPRIKLQIVDIYNDFLIFDTGCLDGISLDKDLFDTLMSRHLLLDLGTTKIAEISGAHDTRKGMMKSAFFGGKVFRNINVSRSMSNDMRIGLEVIRKANIILDFPEKKFSVIN